MRFRCRDLALDSFQRRLEFHAGAVQDAIRFLQSRHLFSRKTRAPKSYSVESHRLDVVPGIQEKRRQIQVHSRDAGNHHETSDLRKLVNPDIPRHKRLVFDLDVTCHQGTTRDHRVVPDLAVVSNVARRHDVVPVADFGDALRPGAARDGVMRANFIVVSDAEITALPGEVLVERIGAQHGAGRNFVAVAERRPALHINIWLQQTVRANARIRLNHTEFANNRLGSDNRVGVHTGGRRDSSGGIDGHSSVFSYNESGLLSLICGLAAYGKPLGRPEYLPAVKVAPGGFACACRFHAMNTSSTQVSLRSGDREESCEVKRAVRLFVVTRRLVRAAQPAKGLECKPGNCVQTAIEENKTKDAKRHSTPDKRCRSSDRRNHRTPWVVRGTDEHPNKYPATGDHQAK